MQRANRAWTTPLCALLAAVPITLATPEASASDRFGVSVSFGSGSASYGHRALAGHLVIDHRTYTIYDNRDFHAQVAGAFKRAGYNAWCRGDRVIVDFRDCHPAVRWSGSCYNVSYQRGKGRLELCFSRFHRPIARVGHQPRYSSYNHSGVTFSARYGSAHKPSYRQHYSPRSYRSYGTSRYSTWGRSSRYRSNSCY